MCRRLWGAIALAAIATFAPAVIGALAAASPLAPAAYQMRPLTAAKES